MEQRGFLWQMGGRGVLCFYGGRDTCHGRSPHSCQGLGQGLSSFWGFMSILEVVMPILPPVT